MFYIAVFVDFGRVQFLYANFSISIVRGCSHTGRPRKNPLTPEEQLEKYKQENEILKQQVEFLKKLRGWT